MQSGKQVVDGRRDFSARRIDAAAQRAATKEEERENAMFADGVRLESSRSAGSCNGSARELHREVRERRDEDEHAHSSTATCVSQTHAPTVAIVLAISERLLDLHA